MLETKIPLSFPCVEKLDFYVNKDLNEELFGKRQLLPREPKKLFYFIFCVWIAHLVNDNVTLVQFKQFF